METEMTDSQIWTMLLQSHLYPSKQLYFSIFTSFSHWDLIEGFFKIMFLN